jgi:hypothetical protein
MVEHQARIDALLDLQARKAALAAEEQWLLHEIATTAPAASLPGCSDKQWVREELASALRIAPCTAGSRLAIAEQLVTELPATLAALAAGLISFPHALRLCEATAELPAETVAQVEAYALARAEDATVAQFKATLKRAVARFDRRDKTKQHEDAVAKRRVDFIAQDDGTTDLFASALPSDAAAAMRDLIHRLAARSRGLDERTADQRRADTLIDLVLGDRPEEQVRPTVQVTVAMSTLLGVDEQPGDLAGTGTIPAGLARALAFDPNGTWRRLVTDEAGQFLDATPDTYRPGAALDRHIRHRDQTCRFPGCRRDSGRTEIDHIIAFAEGGPTIEANLQALCGRHHHLKHETTWQVHRSGDGSTHWTAPGGRRYRQPPPDPLPIDTTMNPPPAPAKVILLDEDPPPF